MSDEHPTDGWEPEAPVSDTLLRRLLFNPVAFHELPAAAAGGRCRATTTGPAATS